MTPVQLHEATRAALRARLPKRFTRADVDELLRITEAEQNAEDDPAESRTGEVDLWRAGCRARVVNALLTLANEEAAP